MNQQMEYLNPDDVFSTYDLGLCCALFCIGHQLYAIDKSDLSNKAQFIFRRLNSIDPDIEAYWNDQLKLNARSYFDAIRTIKNRLYSS